LYFLSSENLYSTARSFVVVTESPRKFVINVGVRLVIYWTRDPVVVRIKSISLVWPLVAGEFVYFNDFFGSLRRYSFAIGSPPIRVGYISRYIDISPRWVGLRVTFHAARVVVLIAQLCGKFFDFSFWPPLVWTHFHASLAKSLPPTKINSKTRSTPAFLFFCLPVISLCHLCVSFCVSSVWPECIYT